MGTTTILHQYEQWLADRHARGEITEDTYATYLREASRIFEILLRHLPGNVIEAYMAAEGYQGSYSHVINALRVMARERGRVAFRTPDDDQPRLPGV